jgi:hypothetical protein
LDTQTNYPKKRCWIPFKQAIIERDGSVRACCYNPLVLGNLNQQDFEAIWYGKHFNNLRDSIVNEEYSYGCDRLNCPVLKEIQS